MPLTVNPAEADALERLIGQRLVAHKVATTPAPPPPDAPPLGAWVRQYGRLIDPVRGEQPFVPRAYQDRLWQDTSTRRLVLKARQVGMSTAIAVESLYYAVHAPDTTTLFVSRSLDLAQDLVKACVTCLRGLPDEYQPRRMHTSALEWSNGSKIQSVAASRNAGRGKPASRVYLDEFAFMAHADDIYTASLPTVSTGGAITILSTPRGRANLFFRLWDGQEGGGRLPLPNVTGGDPNGLWSPHFIHWSECYSPAWAEAMAGALTAQRFASEYDCDFIGSGQGLFLAEDLALCPDGWNPNPRGCLRYVTGWDIGRRHDPCVGFTFGERPAPGGGPTWWHLVAAWREVGIPYPVQAKMIADRWRRLGTSPFDRTRVESNGPGDPLLEFLDVPVKWRQDPPTPAGTPHGAVPMTPRSQREAPNWIEPYHTTAQRKVQGLEALQMLIEQHRLKHGHRQFAEELDVYEWDDETLTQDCVMAGSFAAYEIVGLSPVRAEVPVASGPRTPLSDPASAPPRTGQEARLSQMAAARQAPGPLAGLRPDPALDVTRRRRN